MQVLNSCTSASYMNGPVVEKSSKHRLIDINGFHFVHIHFRGVSLDESGLVNDAAISDRKLGRPLNEPCADKRNTRQRQEPHQQKYRRTVGAKSSGIWNYASRAANCQEEKENYSKQ